MKNFFTILLGGTKHFISHQCLEANYMYVSKFLQLGLSREELLTVHYSLFIVLSLFNQMYLCPL